MPRAYWSILNTFLNNKEIPNIPPLNVEGKIISNFDKKVKLFNSHFAPQCPPINNSSVLPPLEYKTNGRLAAVNIKEDDSYLILKNLNPEKAHGWINISIRMIQLCGKAIEKPLRILIMSFLEEGLYPDDWKKSKVVPLHKKESKNVIKNYRPSSLLPVFSKVFERIILTLCSITYLKINYLLNVNQVFYQVILASHNSFPLQTRYTNLLIVTLQWMEERLF